MQDQQESIIGGSVSWKSAVLVCEKCGEKAQPHVHFSENFRKNLKIALKNLEEVEDEHLHVRTMRTTCHGVCPEGGISICLTTEGRPTQAWVANLEGVHLRPDLIEEIALTINQSLLSDRNRRQV